MLLTQLFTGCGTLRYLLQAGQGQLAIINRAKPIDEVLKDPRTPPRLKALLERIPEIKGYGERHELKPTHNYTHYVALDRPAATWVVSASETLRFKSREWSFPIVGSVPYLGWFDLASAREFAEELKKEGWDVDLRGAPAYSTLGWFEDPVLSSMIAEGEEAMGSLANVVLHESVHATYYVGGQAYFNESLASFVADELTPGYLTGAFGPASLAERAYAEAEAQYERRGQRMHEAYVWLQALYASPRPEAEKLAEKTKYLQALMTELGTKREINNATLIQYKAYNTGKAEFLAIFRKCGSDWKRFWEAMRSVTAESFPESQTAELKPVLEAVVKRSCN